MEVENHKPFPLLYMIISLSIQYYLSPTSFPKPQKVQFTRYAPLALVFSTAPGWIGREVEIAAFAFFDLVEQTRKTLDPQRVSSPKPRPGWDMTWKKSGGTGEAHEAGFFLSPKGCGKWNVGERRLRDLIGKMTGSPKERCWGCLRTQDLKHSLRQCTCPSSMN